MYLKEITVPVPWERKGRIVIRKEKTVEYELERTYLREKQNYRVKRCVIGKLDPLNCAMMHPNEKYFACFPDNPVPEEIREEFLRKCAMRRRMEALKKDPAAMERQIREGLAYLRRRGAEILNEEQEEKEPGREGGDEKEDAYLAGEKEWDVHFREDVILLLRMFTHMCEQMEELARRAPDGTVNKYKAERINWVLRKMKEVFNVETIRYFHLTMERRLIGYLEEIREGMTYSDAMMLMTIYRNAIALKEYDL